MRRFRIVLMLLAVVLVAGGLVACANLDEFDDPVIDDEFDSPGTGDDAPSDTDQSRTATLTVRQAPVEVWFADGSDYEEVSGEVTVGGGDQIRTGSRGLAVITYADGTQTYLYPDGELAIRTLQMGDNGKLIIQLRQTIGLTSNVVNGDNTAVHELETPFGTASMQLNPGTSNQGSRHHQMSYQPSRPLASRGLRPLHSTVFLTVTDVNRTGLQINVVEGQAAVNPPEDQGCDEDCSVDIEAGHSADVGEDGQIIEYEESDVTCENGICTHPRIDEWINDGTLDGDEDYWPDLDDDGSVDDEGCDPGLEDCGDDSFDDEGCDPDFEDCGDGSFDDEGCDPDFEDCGDDSFDDEGCDPDVEDCGDDSYDDEEPPDDDSYDDGDPAYDDEPPDEDPALF